MASCAPDKRSPANQLVVILLGEGFDPLDLGALLRVLRSPLLEPYIAVRLASLGGGLVEGQGDLHVGTAEVAGVDAHDPFQLVLIPGSRGLAEWTDLLDHLRNLPRPLRPICLVGGAAARDRGGPTIQRNEDFWACPGGATSIDLGLRLVERLAGRSAALAVAEELMVPLMRHFDEPAIGATLALQVRGGSAFGPLLHRIRDDLTADLRVETLAEWCNMTPRTFARHFAAQMGMTPAAAIARLRYERAELLMRQGDLTLKEIAIRTGFRSELGLRRARARFSTPSLPLLPRD